MSLALDIAKVPVSTAIKAARTITTQLYDRIIGLGIGVGLRNENLQDELCKKVKELEALLHNVTVTANSTSHKLALERLEQDLYKCLKACDHIERRASGFRKFWSDLRESNELQELDSLLEHSLQNLITVFHSTGNTDSSQRDLETVVQNPQTGFCQSKSTSRLPGPNRNTPERVEKPSVKENSPGVLRASWKSVAGARYYELEYNQQSDYIIVRQSLNHSKCLLDSTKITFPSKLGYGIRVRGIGNGGSGEWSERAVGKFTVLPSPPRKILEIHVKPSTGITLVVEKSPEEEGVKPVTHYVVNYHKVGEERSTEKVCAINELEPVTLQGKDAYRINLVWNIDATSMPVYYCVKISLRNADGDSQPYQEEFRTDTRIPSGEQVELKLLYVPSCIIAITILLHSASCARKVECMSLCIL